MGIARVQALLHPTSSLLKFWLDSSPMAGEFSCSLRGLAESLRQRRKGLPSQSALSPRVGCR
jgi:hypothetical protein